MSHLVRLGVLIGIGAVVWCLMGVFTYALLAGNTCR